MALTASAIYANTVVPDTANTSITAPTGGSSKDAAVGSASVKRVIEKIWFQCEGSTTQSALYFFIYDSGSTKSNLIAMVEIPTRDINLGKSPPVGPVCGWVPLAKPIELMDNTWKILVTVHTSTPVRVTSMGKDYS